MLLEEPKALRLIGPKSFSVDKLHKMKAPCGGWLAKAHCCAICGTDLKIYRGQKDVNSDILGHEFVAEIIEVGAGVNNFEVGERITVATTISCGCCWYCTEGLGNLCQNATRMSLDFPGAFAELIEIPAIALQRGNVIQIPPNLPSEVAVLAEPLSCVLNGQQNAGMRPGLDVLVLGAGPIGLLHVLAARHSGARRIMVSETNPSRLNMVSSFDVDVAIDPNKESLKNRVIEETQGLGVDLAIVCYPSSKAVKGITELLKKRGTLSIFAGFATDDSEITLDGRAIHYNEIKIVGASDSRPEHFALALRMLESFDDSFRPMITHTFPLEKASEAFAILEKGEALKVLFTLGVGK